MWISKKCYEELSLKAELSVKEQIKANKYDDLINRRHGDSLVILDNGIYCMTEETFNRIIDDKIANESRVRALESEITWYQNEYHKLKMAEVKREGGEQA